MEEKRQAERIPVDLKVDCEFEGNFLYESASDISQHGVFIETREPLEIGTEVKLQFTIPDSDENLEVSGRVQWINEPGNESEEGKNPGMGVQFARIRDVDKETITLLLKRLAVLS